MKRMLLRTAIELLIRAAKRDLRGAGYCGIRSVPEGKEAEDLEQAMQRAQEWIECQWGQSLSVRGAARDED